MEGKKELKPYSDGTLREVCKICKRTLGALSKTCSTCEPL